MIHGSLHQNITQIMRQSSKVLRVTLDQAKSKMPTHIISTYAPRNVTYRRRKKHWGCVQELLNKTCKRHLIIWGGDANGQLGYRNHGEEEKYATKKHADQRIIGPYTKAYKTEKEMDQDYTEYAEGNR